MSQSPNLPAANPRQQFLATIARAAEEFALGQPLSVSAKDLQRSIDGVMLAYRHAAIANADLMSCVPSSIARAVALSAMHNLRPGGPLPDVYLLPQRMNGQLHCDWRISWRGYVTLCARAGWRVTVELVFDGDDFEWTAGLFPDLKHTPALDCAESYEQLRCAYVVARRIDRPQERPVFMVVSRATLDARRAASPSRNSGPWQQWPLEMARKAAIRYAIQRGLVALDETAAHAFAEDRDMVEAVPVADQPNTYFIEPPTQQPRGLQAVVAAAESRAPVEPPSSGSQGSAGASENAPAKRGRGRPRKEAAPVDHVAEAQRQARLALLGHAKAAVGELSGAEYEALRERLGLGEDADLGDMGAEQLDRVVREASAIVDERGAE